MWPTRGTPNTQRVFEGNLLWTSSPSHVSVDTSGPPFRYLVNDKPQVFIGMGYNPIYRYLSNEERAANYDRDFRILCEAGVNHILGWDADKGYEQDKFDELTLDYAEKYHIGVVMPFYLPPEANYRDTAVKESLLEQAMTKIERFKDHPALRMWGVGNEVLTDMPPENSKAAFGRFYLQLADFFHSLDPNHPVIYREAEDSFINAIRNVMTNEAHPRPWLFLGMNVYSDQLQRIIEEWPSDVPDRPLFITEFGGEPTSEDETRAEAYVSMWRTIRAFPDYVLGGAPYAWTTEGPEPTDSKWGLMNLESEPADDTFPSLAMEWQKERDTDTR